MQVEKIYLFGNKTKEKPANFCNYYNITNTPLKAQPVKMQDLHYSTGLVLLINNYIMSK